MSIVASKLMPLLAVGGIATHSREAIEKRLSAIIGKEFQTRHNMSMILQSVLHHAIGEEKLVISDQQAFIRKHVSQKYGDPSLDPWGKAYWIYVKGNRVFLVSAGPDRGYKTGDDIAESITLINY